MDKNHSKFLSQIKKKKKWQKIDKGMKAWELMIIQYQILFLDKIDKTTLISFD